MKVAMASPYSLGRVSGVSSVILTLIRELGARGHSIEIVAPEPQPWTFPERATVRTIAIKEPFRDISLGWQTIAELWRTRRQWEILHLHQGHVQTVAAAVLARTLGRPVLATFHSRPSGAIGARGVIERMSNRLLLFGATHRVFVSEDTMSAFGSPGTVIPNGIDVGAIRAALGSRNELRNDLGTNGLLIAYAGRKTMNKGYFDLLEALRKVLDEGVEAHLLVAGDAPDAEVLEIRHRVEALGLQDYVHDLGVVRDYYRFLPAADVFVLPSYREGTPISLLEAMAAGLPVLATRVGGIPEVVRNGKDGLLVAPGDIGALARRLVELARDPLLRTTLAKAAADRAAGFEVSRMASAYVALYERLIA